MGDPSSLRSSRMGSREEPGTERRPRLHSGDPRASKRDARTWSPEQAGDVDALREGRTNIAMHIHENLPRTKHPGSPTAMQGFGQTLNTTVLLAGIKHNGCTGIHQVFLPGSNGPLSLLFSVPFVTSPHMITCAPPPTPTPNQVLGKCFMALNSQLTCLLAARTPRLGGSFWDTQKTLLPWRGPSSPDGPSGLTSSARNTKSPLPGTTLGGDQLTMESQGRNQFALQQERE